MAEKIQEYQKRYRENNSEKITQLIKQYYQHNVEKIKKYQKRYRKNNTEKAKQYYQDNAEKIKQRKRQKFACEICGGKFTIANKAQHFKTKKHSNAV